MVAQFLFFHSYCSSNIETSKSFKSGLSTVKSEFDFPVYLIGFNRNDQEKFILFSWKRQFIRSADKKKIQNGWKPREQ